MVWSDYRLRHGKTHAYKIFGYQDREEWYEDIDGHFVHVFTKYRIED